ncbi:hypothetical protein PHLCEN_2v6042 [Hermanssonia centrifuga]|uniref:Cytochrome c oxidase assembly protein n=1 Tax=Hermanssonia centrifuga TaxID=98765 RepID=A0A2R6P0N5_9APHY|nr:hypothetical protein PHLCEN_2v6042 [Hermanssonia centrifuga]
MSRTAKATLLGSVLVAGGIIWGVHFMQQREADNMYQGVLRDDERRREKMRKREEEYLESQRKRAVYERVQYVPSHTE